MAGEQRVLQNFFISGTLSGNATRYFEAPVPYTFLWAKAWASNDSSATLALSGATNLSITATAIGDSADPATVTAGSSDTAYEAADTLTTITLDYDGDGGTASANVGIIICWALGED